MNNPYYTRNHGERSGRPSAGFGRRHGGNRGDGRRLLHRGELRLLLLKMLEAGPRHGYELIKDIEAQAGGAYAPSPGILYPTLASLEEMGAIVATVDGTRKQFALTEMGCVELAENAKRIEELLARLEDFGKMQASTESGPVRRAMDNLRQVLTAKTDGEPLSKEVQHDIADILDAAASRIERL